MGDFAGRPNIRGLQPIYTTRKGQIIGDRLGGVDGTKEYLAKPGYAINGFMITQGKFRFNGLKILYQRVSGLCLDPSDSYESEWIGDYKDTDTTTTIQSKGRMMVGFTGQGGSDLDGFGAMYMKSYKIDWK